jgi:hypothetical protein
MRLSWGLFLAISISTQVAHTEAKDASCDSVAKSATVSQSNYTFTQHRKAIDNKELAAIQAMVTAKSALTVEDVNVIRRLMIATDKEREALRVVSKAGRPAIYEAAYKYCLGVPLLEEKQIQSDMAKSVPTHTAAEMRPEKDALAEVIAADTGETEQN